MFEAFSKQCLACNESYMFVKKPKPNQKSNIQIDSHFKNLQNDLFCPFSPWKKQFYFKMAPKIEILQ